MRFIHIKSRSSLLLALIMVVSILASSLSPLVAAAAVLPQNSGAKVSFTFDDGLTSALTQAAPALAQSGYTGTNYIITKCIGMTTAPNTCAADTTKSYMTAAQIIALQSQGWEIGSHTRTHPLTAAADNKKLTDAQLDAEMSGSKADLAAIGINATDFASPYGDYDNRSIAVESKYYESHRTFQDPSYTSTLGSDVATPVAGTNTFPYYAPIGSYPYNNYLLTTMEVQGDVSVAAVESAITQAKANNQWLVLVFHEIKADNDPTYSAAKDDYQYQAGNLAKIAAFVKSNNIPVTSMHNGLASGMDIMADSSFNNTIGAYSATTPSTGWTTDSATTIINDKQATSLAGHGSYDGTPTGPLNSIAVKSSTVQTHLFSPRVAITPGTTYTLTNFTNVTSTTGGINYIVDEYDAAGNYITSPTLIRALGPTGNAKTTNMVQVGDVNFLYTPSATAAFARVYADIAPATTGYIDNMRWLSPSGVVVTPPVIVPPVTPSGKSGDVNGDGVINIKDATLVSLNWGKTSATLSQGDANGDGVINIKDATLVSLNWGK
ncbi:MAG: polysaccharide deacetylase family protein [Candidatus Saccharimonadales bacterium]